jgi:hypothetical protein
VRIQATTRSSKSVTKLIRSESDRCAMVKIEVRLPASVLAKSCSTSSGAPVSHWANAGLAMRPLRRIASCWRAFFGKNCSSSKTPRRSKGGSLTARMRSDSSRAWPRSHAWVRMLASRMASRERSGSESTSTRPSSAATKPLTSSERSSPGIEA